jgi:hypothetical protein
MFHAFLTTEALPCTSNDVPNTLSNTGHIFHRRAFSSSERHLSAGINFDLQNVAKFVSRYSVMVVLTPFGNNSDPHLRNFSKRWPHFYAALPQGSCGQAPRISAVLVGSEEL